MKLIIDIPEEDWKRYKRYKKTRSEFCARESVAVQSIVDGTPLDDVKAEIEQICQDIDTCSHNEYENAVEQGKEIAYENVLDILDNIGKAESEEKPNE